MNTRHPTTRDGERRFTRRELEAVIRRAAELSAADAEAEEHLSEDELLRIAAELGLSARHVRQALLELPDTQAEDSVLSRICGPGSVSVSRVVPSVPELALSRLDEYLATREFLRPLRRQPGRIWYAPADDVVSSIARAFSRPSGKFHLARARRTALAVQPLEPGWSLVRLELDLSDRRKGVAAAGTTVGALFAVPTGIALGAAAGAAAGDLLGSAAAVAAGVLTGGSILATGVAVGLGIARASLRRRLAAARMEVEGLLDRLEHDERLEPPPTPWRRRLRAKIARDLLPKR